MLDTIEVTYKKDIYSDNKVYLSLKNYISKNSTYELKNNRIVVKPNKNKTSFISEMLKCKNEIDKIIGEIGEITRIDLAFDTLKSFKSEETLFKIFLSCLMYIRNEDLKILYKTIAYNFKKSEIQTLNLKIKKGNKETTIYYCEDKTRECLELVNPYTKLKISLNAKSRIENRSMKIRNSFSDFEKIFNEITKYICELEQIISDIENNNLIYKIEKFYIEMIYNQYHENKETFKSVSEFIRTSEDLFLTKNILAEFLKMVNYESDIDNFIRKYRSSRSESNLQFVFKKNLIDLIKDIIKDMKNTLN